MNFLRVTSCFCLFFFIILIICSIFFYLRLRISSIIYFASIFSSIICNTYSDTFECVYWLVYIAFVMCVMRLWVLDDNIVTFVFFFRCFLLIQKKARLLSLFYTLRTPYIYMSACKNHRLPITHSLPEIQAPTLVFL